MLFFALTRDTQFTVISDIYADMQSAQQQSTQQYGPFTGVYGTQMISLKNLVARLVASSDYDRQILRAQVESIIVPLPTLIIGVTMFVPLVFFALYDRVGADKTTLIIWAATWLLFALVRGYNYMTIRNKQHFTTTELWTYASLTVVTMFAAAATWSMVIVAYLDYTDTFVLVLIIAVTAAISGGILSSYAALFHIVFIFVSITNGVLTYALFASTHPDAEFFAWMSLIVLMVYVTSAKRSHRLFRDLVVARLKQQQLVRDLDEKNRIAEEASRSKSQFLAAASHDLRQPAHAMSLYLELLGKRSDPAILDHIRVKLGDSLDALRSQLNTILDISRLDANSLENHPDNISTVELLGDIERVFEARCHDRGLELSVEPGDFRVYADRIHVNQILINLISNAIQYTDEGSVTVRAEDSGDNIILSVADTGIGIDAEHQEAIFDEFIQLNNPERDKRKGYGLGLSICKRLALLIGANLTMVSETGKGSTFSIALPKGVLQRGAGHERSNHHPVSTDLSGRNVLLIEDDIDIRESMQMLLEQWHTSRVEIAVTQDDVVDIIDSGFVPDLILSDYRLTQNERGDVVVAHARKKFGTKIPTVIITGDTTAGTITDDEGVPHRVINKPIAISQLASAIDAVLE